MRDTIFHSIIDELVHDLDAFPIAYVGTLEETLNVYDTASKVGCYIVLSGIDKNDGQIRMAKLLAAEMMPGHEKDLTHPAKQIQFEAANLLHAYISETKPDAKVVRGIVAIPKGLVWPAAIANFMTRGDNGQWIRMHRFDD